MPRLGIASSPPPPKGRPSSSSFSSSFSSSSSSSGRTLALPSVSAAPATTQRQQQQQQQQQILPFGNTQLRRLHQQPPPPEQTPSRGRVVSVHHSRSSSGPHRPFRSGSREKVSVPRLFTCLAPDGKSILSLSSTIPSPSKQQQQQQQQQQRFHPQSNNDEEELFFIEWQPLPLTTNSDQEEDELSKSKTMFQSPPADNSRRPTTTTTASSVTIRLPDHVQESLRRHAPLELICVDGDRSSASLTTKTVTPDHRAHSSVVVVPLPILCVYTSKDAFLLELAVDTTATTNDASYTPGRTAIRATTMNPQQYNPYTPVTSPPPFNIAGGSGSSSGKIIAVTEPFESHLLDASCSTRIVRIRPAPQVRMGYDTLCRPRAMAMLTYDRESNQYALTLYHGYSQQQQQQQQYSESSSSLFTTQPLTFGTEYRSDDDQDLITDFCFAQSEGLSLFSSLSVLLLQESGNVLCASPVLFDGTVVYRESVEACLGYLEEQYQQCLDPKSAKWRQCKAATAFLTDVFGEELTKTRDVYLTARVRALLHRECAVHWPLAIQGPIILTANPAASPQQRRQRQPHRDILSTPAVSIEPFYSPTLVGVAIGRVGRGVDLALVSPTGLLPRFSFESTDDRFQLDDALQQLGVVVDRIQVDTTTTPTKNSSSSSNNNDNDAPYNAHLDVPTLIADPVVKTILHSVSFSGVLTISTNVMHVASQEICGGAVDRDDEEGVGASSSLTRMEKRTTAWTSLQVATGWEGNHLQGVIVTRDASLGHVLMALLSNGSLETINLTEARALYDTEALPKVEDESDASSTSTALISNAQKSTADAALKAVEAMTPLYGIVEPLMKKITDGLAGMGKIVGSETATKDITPEMLAVVVAIKERCDRDVVLPLLELREVTSTRYRELQSMYKRQLIQLESLKDMVKSLTERMDDLTLRLTTVQSNATTLAERGAYLLQASQDLQPTLTRAEREYHDMLKALSTKCAEWKEKLRKLQDSCARTCESVELGQTTNQSLSSTTTTTTRKFQLPPDFVENANTLLRGEAIVLKRGEERLQLLDAKVATLSKELGIST